MANEIHGVAEVLDADKGKDEPVGEPKKLRKALLNPAVMDVAFSGNPVQCEQPTCETMKTDFEWRRRMDTEESSRYKYIIDVSRMVVFTTSVTNVSIGRWEWVVIPFQTTYV